jgi:hypothetical protein
MNFYGEDKSPERHSIHGNSPSPVRHKGNMDIHMPNGGNFTNQNTNYKKPIQNVPYMGNNIDGIPMPNNRSPPRNSGGSSSGGSVKDNSSPILDNQNPSYLN